MRFALVLVGLLALVPDQRAFRSDPPTTCDSCAAWNAPQAPFRVFGNTYYVGPAGLASVLVTSPDGHVLLDGALPQSAAVIDANIRALGFRPEDIRLIVASHAHFDHVGGIAALARLSGARVAGSAPTARALEHGNLFPEDPQFGFGPVGTAFPIVPYVTVVGDGDALHVGALALTSHLTPGHTPGSTTWTWRACDAGQCLDVVYADSLTAVSAPGFRFTGDGAHPSLVAAFRQSLATVERLPCDILLTVHPEFSHVADKLAKRAATPGVNPFIDPGACWAYVHDARETLETRIASEGRAKRP
jgi:metallo-beta-lactamase class B